MYSGKYPSPEQMNEGVMFCSTHGGADIWMLLAEPGHYYNLAGKEVSDDEARRAGFDVDRFRLQRIRGEKRAAALARVDAELRAELERRADEPEPPPAPEQGTDDGTAARLAKDMPLPRDFQKIAIPERPRFPLPKRKPQQ